MLRGLGFAVYPKNEIIKIMMEDYDRIHFLENGKMDLTACTRRNTKTLIDKGYIIDNKHDMVGNLRVYEREYFCGFDVDNNNYIITDNTYTVHHYNASWVNSKSRLKKYIKRKVSKVIGIENYKKIRMFKNKYKNNGK